jgi:hypothetical protein
MSETVEMKKVCGWCGTDLGTIKVAAAEAPKVKEEAPPAMSHGMCEKCSDTFVTKAEEMFAGVA